MRGSVYQTAVLVIIGVEEFYGMNSLSPINNHKVGAESSLNTVVLHSPVVESTHRRKKRKKAGVFASGTIALEYPITR